MAVRTDQDAWVYVFSTDTNGTTRQLFPNGFTRDNFVRSGRLVRLPGSISRLVALPPHGTTQICAFATTEQFDWLRRYDLVGSAGDPFPVRHLATSAFRMRLEESVWQAGRVSVVRGDSISMRPGVGGVVVSHAGGTGEWRSVPSCGFTTRSITVFEPTRPIHSTIDEFAWGQHGSSFQFNSSRGGVTREPQVALPPRVSFVPVQPAWRVGNAGLLLCPTPMVIPRHSTGVHQARSSQPTSPHRRERVGTLSVTSSPSGADVFIDGRSWGATPLRAQLPPGSYDIQVQRHGHGTESRSVRVQSSRTESLRVTLPRR
jgi:hypothetical protein